MKPTEIEPMISEAVGVPFCQDPAEDLEENVADGMTVRQLAKKLDAELIGSEGEVKE